MSETLLVPRVAETTAEVREQLEEHGYANVPVGINNAQTAELFQSFKTFIDLTEQPGGEAFKEAITYTSRPKYKLLGNELYDIDLRIPGKVSTGRGVPQDHKYIYHFGPQTYARAQSRLGNLPDELDNLLDNCAEFYHEGRKAAMLGSMALGLQDVLFHKDLTKEVNHLRLIDYIASENKGHAKPHFDRSVATLAINESHPGLRGVASDNGYLAPLSEETKQELRHGMQPVAHRESVGKFFTSAGLRRLPEELRNAEALDQLPIFAHDVVNEKPGVNRYAAVMFFNPHLDYLGYTVPKKEETDTQILM